MATSTVTTLAGQIGVLGTADGFGTAATFCDPTGVALDAAGETGLIVGCESVIPLIESVWCIVPHFHTTALVQVDTDNARIRRVVISSALVTTVAGKVSGSADGFGSAASFYQPTGVALDASGTVALIVSRYRRIDCCSDLCIAITSVRLQADRNNNKFRRIIVSTGEVRTVFGSLSGASGASDGVGTSSTFNTPWALR